MRHLVAGLAVRLAVLAGTLGAVLLPGGTAWAVAYFGYEQWGGTWHDANKMPESGDESYFCWAASAANVLAWGGWTTPAFDTGQKIYREFTQRWTDEQSLEDRAWRWWIDGTMPSDPQGWSHPVRPGGGALFDRAFDDLYRANFTPKEALPTVERYLRDGYGVTLAIFPNTRIDGHSLTVWGYEYDPGTLQYTTLWVTDSDDRKWIDRGLKPLAVSYDDIFHWWELSDPIDGAYDGWYIAGVQGLYNNLAQASGTAVAGAAGATAAGLPAGTGGLAAVPEPGMPALLVSGALAFGLCLCRHAARRRGRRAGATG